MKRSRPDHALGGGANKDHLFENGRSKCGKYWYGGGTEVKVDEDEQDLVELAENGELCKKCMREAGIDL